MKKKNGRERETEKFENALACDLCYKYAFLPHGKQEFFSAKMYNEVRQGLSVSGSRRGSVWGKGWVLSKQNREAMYGAVWASGWNAQNKQTK